MGLNGTYINNIIEVELDSRFHFADRINQTAGDASIISVYEPERSRDISLDLTYFLFTKIRRVKREVVIGNYSRNLKEYITIPIDVDFKFGVSAGGQIGSHFQYFRSYNDFRTLDGAVFISPLSQSMSSMMGFSMLHMGVNLTTVNRTVVETTKYGIRKSSTRQKFYIRGYLLTHSILDDVLTSYDVYGESTNLSGSPFLYTITNRFSIDHVERKLFGYSIGWKVMGFLIHKKLVLMLSLVLNQV